MHRTSQSPVLLSFALPPDIDEKSVSLCDCIPKIELDILYKNSGTMPYVIVATQTVDDGPRGIIYGPTVVGDQHSDPILMGQLGASVTKITGYNFFQFTTEDLPRIVLDKLETLGYKVVAMTGTYPEWSWILHKPESADK